MLYGNYCKEALIAYHYDCVVGHLDKLTTKMIFISNHNTLVGWKEFKETGKHNPIQLMLPLKCLRVGSYENIIKLFKWVKDVMYILHIEKVLARCLH